MPHDTQLIVYDPGSEAPRESESATRDRTETSSALRGRGPGSGRVHRIMQLAPPTPPRPSASHVRLRTSYPCELNTWERPGRRPTGAPPYAMCHAPDSAPYAHAPMRLPPHARRLTPRPAPHDATNDRLMISLFDVQFQTSHNPTSRWKLPASQCRVGLHGSQMDCRDTSADARTAHRSAEGYLIRGLSHTSSCIGPCRAPGLQS
jgi:hypothetical protein